MAGPARERSIEGTRMGALDSLPPLGEWPRVSVVIPALNEERYIGALLDSLERQTYPAERLEVIVADGRSDDRTRAIVEEHAKQTRLARVELVDNPDRAAPEGLNAGVGVARGDVVAILGAHSKVAPDWAEANVRALRETNAAAVGGPIETVGQSEVASAIAAALSHPFGVGNARFRYATEAGEVDTIAFAAYRRECFAVVGLFDPERKFAVDDNFNYRVRAAGGRLYLDPRIRSTYFARSEWRSAALQYFRYGRAKGRVMVDVPGSISVRHLVPAAAVVAGALLGVGAPGSRRMRALLLLSGGSYAALAAVSARKAAVKQGNAKLASRVALAFPLIHAAYGGGTLLGLVEAARRKLGH